MIPESVASQFSPDHVVYWLPAVFSALSMIILLLGKFALNSVTSEILKISQRTEVLEKEIVGTKKFDEEKIVDTKRFELLQTKFEGHVSCFGRLKREVGQMGIVCAEREKFCGKAFCEISINKNALERKIDVLTEVITQLRISTEHLRVEVKRNGGQND